MIEENEEKEYYRRTLHSRLLCENNYCDICNKKPLKCRYVEVSYPVDTTGNRKVYKCYCKTTGCTNISQVKITKV